MDQIQQVFWLSDQPSQTPSRQGRPRQWLAHRLVSDVPDYSGGTAAEFHRVPGYWMVVRLELSLVAVKIDVEWASAVKFVETP